MQGPCVRLTPLLARVVQPHANPLARGLAKKAKASEAPKSKPSGLPSSTTVVGSNILKDGQDAELRPDSEYPEWLWTVHKPLPSLPELTARYQADPESLSLEERKRVVKQWNKGRIKERNARMAK